MERVLKIRWLLSMRGMLRFAMYWISHATDIYRKKEESFDYIGGVEILFLQCIFEKTSLLFLVFIYHAYTLFPFQILVTFLCIIMIFSSDTIRNSMPPIIQHGSIEPVSNCGKKFPMISV